MPSLLRLAYSVAIETRYRSVNNIYIILHISWTVFQKPYDIYIVTCSLMKAYSLDPNLIYHEKWCHSHPWYMLSWKTRWGDIGVVQYPMQLCLEYSSVLLTSYYNYREWTNRLIRSRSYSSWSMMSCSQQYYWTCYRIGGEYVVNQHWNCTGSVPFTLSVYCDPLLFIGHVSIGSNFLLTWLMQCWDCDGSCLNDMPLFAF